MTITVVILTKNEERHVERAIRSTHTFATRVFVIDSGSTDATVPIAKSLGATVFSNPWVNQSVQFNWAMLQLPEDTEWVFRLDADEIVRTELASDIALRVPEMGTGVTGLHVHRRMSFLGREIRWGGVFPIRIIRLFRHGHGQCENRWMDEHIVVDGETRALQGEILDDNRNPLGWWIEKHNLYASREVVDILNVQYGLLPPETTARLDGGNHMGLKRWMKENVYARTPGGLRALIYFLYRYIVRLGFLDGVEGTAFHVLQGFWYRYLVDMKLHEVRSHMAQTGATPVEAIESKLGIVLGQCIAPRTTAD